MLGGIPMPCYFLTKSLYIKMTCDLTAQKGVQRHIRHTCGSTGTVYVILTFAPSAGSPDNSLQGQRPLGLVVHQAVRCFRVARGRPALKRQALDTNAQHRLHLCTRIYPATRAGAHN